jgi:hypothetical protein
LEFYDAALSKVHGLTIHSTGARVSLHFIVNLAVSVLNARPVNAGVMLLLNESGSHSKLMA